MSFYNNLSKSINQLFNTIFENLHKQPFIGFSKFIVNKFPDIITT